MNPISAHQSAALNQGRIVVLESEICAASDATSTPNRAARAFRLAPQALRKSQTGLGAHHRRLCARMDKPKAITASAHKQARLVYFTLNRGQALVEAGQGKYE